MREVPRAAFALAVVITACVGLANWALAFRVVLTAKVDGGDRPVVVGSTNLPDGTELMVTVARKEIGYMAQDKARVSEGKFQAGPFSRRGAGLSPGNYNLEVLTPYAAVQPAAVRAVMGNKGVALRARS